jgi:predicted ribosome quality control (RQC) complex YloA/Tae2 family protein
MPDFRTYKIAGGIEVWVGKDSRSNDLLTMRFTEDDDLWFHVRGTSGSHTVLKVEKSKGQKVDRSKGQKVEKEHIEKAAAIAAWHSKARNAKRVTVAYTPGKYVRKYKGAKEGSVVIGKEKTVKVSPWIPEEG